MALELGHGQMTEEFIAAYWESLHCHQQSVKGDSVESSERKEDSCLSSKEYLSDCKQNVGINEECKDHSFEISDRKEECAIGNQEKRQSKNLSELCF